VRRPLLLLAALAATVAVMAVRLAPAAVIDASLAQLTHGRLRIVDPAGTVWDARGVMVAGAMRIPVAWQIDAWPLLRGELVLHVVPAASATSGPPRAEIVIRDGHITLRNADATIPAGLVTAALGTGAAWVVGGDLSVSATGLEWAPPANRGDARVQWRAARLIPPGGTAAFDLGDVSLVLVADGDRLSGPVSNVGGDLAINGEVALHAASVIALTLVLTPRRADNVELMQALAMLGPPAGDGWRVDWRSPLR
jgi:hypothetical protein